MLKLLKITLLILMVGIIYVVINEVSSYNYIYPEYQIKFEEIHVLNNKSILIQDPNILIPVKYSGTLNFDTIPEEIRKAVFINLLLPAIAIERDRLLDALNHIEFIENRMINKRKLRTDDVLFYKNMMEQYDATSIKDLKIRVYPHPASLVLAQAILESGWGTSKVFSKANNPFGIMSFSSDEPRRKFTNPETQTEVYVRSYSNVNQSVEHYYYFLSKLGSYEKFRKKRWERGSSFALVKLMKSYHETKDYPPLVESIIKTNELEKYDNITISKDYFQYKRNYMQLVKSYFIDYF
ncbi:MAG: glucosaminidase domain-containing protein [Prolixibacteraceae bacterium]